MIRSTGTLTRHLDLTIKSSILPQMSSKPTVYAIDFGTSNSLLAAANSHEVFAPIPLDPEAPDPSVLRSLLYYPNQNNCYFGTQAVEEYLHRDFQGRLIRSIKRFLPMRSFTGTFVEERPLKMEDIIGRFLREMRQRANAHFGVDVEAVVLGRPAKFSSVEADDALAQERLETSAKLAGFKSIEFCPEPVAAAREFRAQMAQEKLVFVADFGGGTSDFTVVRLGPRAYQSSDVLAVGGVAVAGDVLDGSLMRRRIAPHFGADVRYQAPMGSNFLTMPISLNEKLCAPAELAILRKQDTLQFLRNVQQWALEGEDKRKMDQLIILIEDQLGFGIFESIEATKRALSLSSTHNFLFEYPGVKVSELITRKNFDEYIQVPVQKILAEVDETLKSAGLRASDIDVLCCTGGTAKVGAIQEGLSDRFGAAKLQQHKNFHSVVQGLAEQAREMSRNLT